MFRFPTFSGFFVCLCAPILKGRCPKVSKPEYSIYSRSCSVICNVSIITEIKLRDLLNEFSYKFSSEFVYSTSNLAKGHTQFGYIQRRDTPARRTIKAPHRWYFLIYKSHFKRHFLINERTSRVSYALGHKMVQ